MTDSVGLQINVKQKQDQLPQEIINKFQQKKFKEQTNSPIIVLKNKQSNEIIPLKQIQYKVKIINSLSIVEIIQEYENPYDFNIETEYFFAISPTSVFIELEATLNDKILKGIIKEKKEAKQEYQQALKEGKTAVFAEIVEELHDTMKLNLGNLLANQKAIIKFTYLENLDIAMNKFWKFTIGNTFSGRSLGSQPVSDNLQKVSNPRSIQAEDEQSYSFDLNIVIESPSEINFLESPSHPIAVEISEDKKSAFISLDKKKNKDRVFKPNKEFILFYKNKDINKPQSSLGKDKDGVYAGYITFFPDFNQQTDHEVYQNLKNEFQQNSNEEQPIDKTVLIQNEAIINDFKIPEKSIRAEYIFIVDRSGSMGGDRIENTKIALIEMLKILPTDSYFDIICFGSFYDSIFHEEQYDNYFQKIIRGSSNTSVKKNQYTLSLAIDKIEQFYNDYGGTEIYAPLDYALQTSVITGYPKNIFLLTDGQVWNEDQIAKLVRQHSQRTNLRVYSIGIGNGVSKNFIKSVAIEGNGKFEFINDLQNMTEKLSFLIKDSITPFLEHFHLQYDNQIIQMMVPEINQIQQSKSIRKNEPLQIFIMLNQNFQKTEFNLKYYDSVSDSEKQFVIKIDKIMAENHEYFHKLVANKLIKQILNNQAFDQHFLQDVIYKNAQHHGSVMNLLTDLSIKYQVLCEVTAFVLVDELKQDLQNQNQKYHQQTQKIDIPIIESIDYGNKGLSSQSQDNLKINILIFIIIMFWIF